MVRPKRLTGSSHLGVESCPVVDLGASACPPQAPGQNTGLVVGLIAVSPSGALDLLDRGVGGLSAGVGNACTQEYLDLVPSLRDGG